jgi:predicted transglutaminase-like cysteine proteinase
MPRTREVHKRLGRPGGLAAAWVLVIQLAAAGGLSLSHDLLDRVGSRYGKAAAQRLLRWQQVMEANRDRPETEKLGIVNELFNRLRFLDDRKNWGKKDYWATPVEMLSANAGDCEDFSIAKYFTLKEMGVPGERLRITYVKSLSLDQAHMVLAYYPAPDAEPVLLDNLTDEIRPASERTDLVPVYSFNAEGLWLAVQRGQGRWVGGGGRIAPWRDLAMRMEKEHGKQPS